MLNTERREWYLANREHLIKKARIWALNNPERVKENHKRWRDRNKDKIKKAELKYRKTNPKKYLFNLAKRRAKRKNQEFTITLDDLPDIPEYCPLLKLAINSWSEEQSHHPSLDRIDNHKGYIPGNVWFISHRANMLKNNATSDELLCLVINWLELEK